MVEIKDFTDVVTSLPEAEYSFQALIDFIVRILKDVFAYIFPEA